MSEYAISIANFSAFNIPSFCNRKKFLKTLKPTRSNPTQFWLSAHSLGKLIRRKVSSFPTHLRFGFFQSSSSLHSSDITSSRKLRSGAGWLVYVCYYIYKRQGRPCKRTLKYALLSWNKYWPQNHFSHFKKTFNCFKSWKIEKNELRWREKFITCSFYSRIITMMMWHQKN